MCCVPGVGIPKGTRSRRIFERFYREPGGSGSGQPAPGPGIGLASRPRHPLRMHGLHHQGRQPRQGEGSVFTFSRSRWRPPPRPRPPGRARPPAPSAETPAAIPSARADQGVASCCGRPAREMTAAAAAGTLRRIDARAHPDRDVLVEALRDGIRRKPLPLAAEDESDRSVVDRLAVGRAAEAALVPKSRTPRAAARSKRQVVGRGPRARRGMRKIEAGEARTAFRGRRIGRARHRCEEKVAPAASARPEERSRFPGSWSPRRRPRSRPRAPRVSGRGLLGAESRRSRDDPLRRLGGDDRVENAVARFRRARPSFREASGARRRRPRSDLEAGERAGRPPRRPPRGECVDRLHALGEGTLSHRGVPSRPRRARRTRRTERVGAGGDARGHTRRYDRVVETFMIDPDEPATVGIGRAAEALRLREGPRLSDRDVLRPRR